METNEIKVSTEYFSSFFETYTLIPSMVKTEYLNKNFIFDSVFFLIYDFFMKEKIYVNFRKIL